MSKTKTNPPTSPLRVFARRLVRTASLSANWLMDLTVELLAFIPIILDLLFGPSPPVKINFPHITLGAFISSNDPPAPCYLTFEALNTHLHGRGLTRTGKSKLVQHICRELERERQGFTLIDPNGELFWLVAAD